LTSIDHSYASFYASRVGLNKFAPHLGRQFGGNLGPASEMRQHALDLRQKLGIRGLAQVMAVEIFQLGEVEPRRRTSDLRKVEGGDHLLGREDFLIAMAPAEPNQIIAHP